MNSQHHQRTQHDQHPQHPQRHLRVAVIGLGNMNGAILAGLLAAGADPERFTATTRSALSATQAGHRYGVRVIAEQDDPETNRIAVRGADVVLLGVKPKDILATARGLQDALPQGAVVVSVAAGVTLSALAGALPAGQPVVRAMPNTPLTVGRGVVGLAAGPGVSDAQLEAVTGLFAASGLVRQVDEQQLGAVVAVAGSAPAYVFRFVEALAAGGVELGLDEQTALELAQAAVAGAGAMLAQDGADPSELRRAITSPGGTTHEAITALEEGGLDALVLSAMRAGTERDAQMAGEFAD